MKTKLLIISMLIFTAITKLSLAQWTQVGYMIANATDTVPDCHGFKGFGTNTYSPTDSGLFVTADNGASWQILAAHRKTISVHVGTDGAIYAGTDKRIFKSTNNGANWHRLLSLPDSTTFYDITEIGTNILASWHKGTNNGVYYSSDTGATWQTATGITSTAKYFLVDGIDVYVGGTANGVYKSTDNGQSWAVLGTGIPTSSGIWSVKKLGNGLFANSVTGAGLFASYDNGGTWNNANSLVFNGFCQVFSIAESSNMIIASMDGACNSSAPIKVSLDTGLTWNTFMTGLPNTFFPNVGRNFSGTSFFAKEGGFNGLRVYRYDLTTTGIKENEYSYNQLSISPNPTTGKFTIKNLNNVNKTTVEIYNVIGEIILSKQNTNEIDLSDSPKGIYFVKVIEGKNISFNKVVVEQ